MAKKSETKAREPHPAPMSTATLIAPDKQFEVQRTIDEHPEIDSMGDDAERGSIIDITARRINPAGGEKPWGRKARNNDPNNPNCNGDGMTFLRPDGLFEIYDCISGTDGQSSWEGWGPYAPGENGYWWPPNPVEDGGDTGGGGGDLEARLVQIEADVAALKTQSDALVAQASGFETRLVALEAHAAAPQHCHGPIDLPVVLDGFSLRTRGDINVAVTPGEATPPAPPGNSSDLATWLALKRLLNRRDDDTTPPSA